ncbi:MAG: hypothetical protein EOO39_13775 [Cytophagaceae bacterium]|nr:MAG: hypothetical protein EOO39_13775 [Cytophagaceae bacterium]
MARPTPELIDALRRTARNVAEGAPYQWGHMGSCNCGNLAQELTRMTKDQIHQYAMQRYGDWNEQVADYCDTSQLPFDVIINQMLQAGLSLEDLRHLEKLDDRDVLRRFPIEQRFLKHNRRDDVVTYLNEWANLLEDRLLAKIKLPADLLEIRELV